MDLHPAARTLLQERACGWLWFAVLEPGETTDVDSAIATVGLAALADQWQEVDRARASAILIELLHRELAYRTELRPISNAIQLSSALLAAVPERATRFATNAVEFPGANPWLWEPATDHTFDAGVVAIGPRGGFVYWVADED